MQASRHSLFVGGCGGSRAGYGTEGTDHEAFCLCGGQSSRIRTGFQMPAANVSLLTRSTR